MRTKVEIQSWLDKNPVKKDEVQPICNWLNSIEEYNGHSFSLTTNVPNAEKGLTLIDVIEFVNSPYSQTDLNPLVAQFEKVEKEMLKMRKLINKL